MDDLETSAAVIECLARCGRTAAPGKTIVEFVQHLQVWRDWPHDAAQEVGRRVQQAARRSRTMVTSH